MIKNFNIRNERFEEWEFEKYYPYTFQIKGISKRCISIIGNLTPSQLDNFIKHVNFEISNFCKSEGKNAFYIAPYPTVQRFFDYLKALNKLQKSRNQRKDNIFAKQAAYLGLRYVDYAIDGIKEGKLELASNILQGAEKLIRHAESLDRKNKDGKANRAERNDHQQLKALKEKVFNIFESNFVDEESGEIKYYGGSRRATAKRIFDKRSGMDESFYLSKSERELLSEKNGAKTIEGWIKECEQGVTMVVYY